MMNTTEGNTHNTGNIHLTHDTEIVVAIAKSRWDKELVNRKARWSELVQLLSQTTRTPETLEQYAALKKTDVNRYSNIKDVGGFIGGQMIDDGPRSNGRMLNRYLLTLDADEADDDFLRRVELFFPDHAYAVYSTHGHGVNGSSRYRLIIPMTESVTPDEFEAISRKVADQIGMHVFDRTTHQYARLMFFPSTAYDGEFVFEYKDRPILNPRDVLATYQDPMDRSTWPKHDSEEKIFKRERKKGGAPGEKPGYIGAFNRVYAIEDAMEQFISDVYTDEGGGRYTFNEGTSVKGVMVVDGYLYSHHSTDPVHGRSVNAFDMVRIHLFGDLDEDVPESAKMSSRPSYREMIKLIKEDDAVVAELQKEIFEKNGLDTEHEEGMPVNIDLSELDGIDGGDGGSDNDDDLVAVDPDDDDKLTVHLPEDIFVPDYLEYLEGMKVTVPITNKALLQLGVEALKHKIVSVEMYNMAGPSIKKRIPNSLDFDDVAIIMMTLYTFKNIQMTDRMEDTLLAMYDNRPNSGRKGTYITGRENYFKIMERLAPRFKERDMQDVLAKITRSVDNVRPTKDRYLFAVNNGIFNQRTKELQPFDAKHIFMTKIPVDYTIDPTNPVLIAPDGYKWDVETWISDIMDDDADSVTLMWQIIADCLQPNYSRDKSIWFYSEKGNNGKGTVGQLIKNVLGKGNYASLGVADFKHEFLKSTLLGVAANIADENDVDTYIDSVKDYKASVTGDDINVNVKYEQPLRIQFTGTNIQMMNGLPKTKDKSDSFYRRVLLVPFLRSFTNNGERKYIKDDYINRKEVLEYVLHKALHIEFDEFILPLRSAELLDEYKEDNNPVMSFWNELKDEFSWDLLPSQFLFDLYIKWTDRNNPSGGRMSKSSFLKQLRNVIVSQGDGWVDSTGTAVRPKGLMDTDEPLISEYNMDRPDRNGAESEWMVKGYKGTSATKRRDFKRKATYRGFKRA